MSPVQEKQDDKHDTSRMWGAFTINPEVKLSEKQTWDPLTDGSTNRPT